MLLVLNLGTKNVLTVAANADSGIVYALPAPQLEGRQLVQVASQPAEDL